MKVASFRYLTREGIRSLWQNRFMAIASIIVLVSCLLLTGGSYLIFVNIDNAFDWVYGQNIVAAFTVEDFDAGQREPLTEKLLAIPNIDKVEMVSKEELLEKYGNSMPDDITEQLAEKNPYSDVFLITLTDVALQEQSISFIYELSEIDELSYNADIADILYKTRHAVLLIGGWIIALLMLVSLFIISNTIKLTVFNRRLEISIMKSVGATNAFVRFPFVVEGVLLGALSAAAAFGVTFMIYDRMVNMFASGIGILNFIVDFSSVSLVVLCGYLAIGILMGLLGSIFSAGRYLRKDGGLSELL